MQYTLRNVPKKVDQALRARAKASGKSINETAVEILKVGLGLVESERKRDLTGIAGTWVEDPAFDAIMKEQDQIDPEMWR